MKGQQQNRGTLTTQQFFNALNKYIPSLVLQNWLDKSKREEEMQRKEANGRSVVVRPTKEPLPYIQDTETVVLFADISGFTNISEACAKMGIRGNEELAFCINRYMEGMVKNLAKFGGDIIKFVGDAMIVMWPRYNYSKDDDNLNDEDEKVMIVRKAIQCAFDIQKEMNNKKIMASVTGLSVKIGIAFGKCALLYVGGVFDRSEFFTIGPALTHALKSEEQAEAGGQILVSETAFKYVKNIYYDGIEIISEENKKFYRITKVIEGVKGRADSVLMKSNIKIDSITAIQKTLRSCVPAAIMPFLEIGYEQYGSETRALTVMFASLGVELSSADTKEGKEKIQRIITTVQQQVYRQEGSLNKLVMDDKGSTLICIWGLCPMAHTDDPTRAILTAMNMRRELAKIDGTWCNVGIATGDVFSGVVGTSGSRKEFSVLGDTVNLAARIMFWPKKKKQVGKINVCMRTKNEAMSQLSFNYGDHCEFKGKSISIPIFEPIEPSTEFSPKEWRHKIIPPQAMLKLHYNPLIVQRQVNFKKSEPFIGKTEMFNNIYEKIKNYYFGSHSDNRAMNIVITGVTGSGKTHLLRAICEKIQKDSDFNREPNTFLNKSNKKALDNSTFNNLRETKGKFPIYASASNCESKLKFLGAWRPILRNIFEAKRKKQDTTREFMFKQMITQNPDKIDLLFDIFGALDSEKDMIMKGFQTKEDQVANLNLKSPIGFLLKEKYSNRVTDSLLDFLVNYIREFTGHIDPELSLIKSSNSSRLNSEVNLSKNQKNLQFRKAKDEQVTQCMFIFDNASILEEESFSLLIRVYFQLEDILTIMVLDQDQKGLPIFPKLDVPKQQGKSIEMSEVPYQLNDSRLLGDFIDSAQIYDIPGLSEQDLEKLLLDCAQRYKETYTDEISLMTKIVDPEHTIKTEDKCKEWLELLTKQYNLEHTFTSIEPGIIKTLLSKCNGNTLYCFQFFFNLLTNGFIGIDSQGHVYEKDTFKYCKRLQNFTKIPVPATAIKKRLKNLDTFLKDGRSNKSLKKQEIAVKGLMLLKSAAIIGEEFGTDALKKIAPLRNETQGSILMILKELELAELIEILDETDPKNVYCRFNQAFLRETIYQVMLYRDQKRVLHQQMANYMLSLPAVVMTKEQIDIEIDKLRDHILIGEDVKSEEELPFKQKYGIIVKQMQNILVNGNPNMPLYKNYVFKQGKKASKKISKRLLILTSKTLQWFHNAQEYETNKQPLGSIQVEHIFKVFETLMQARTFDFEVAVTQYIRKGIIDENVRNIKFGCESENDRNNWISRIEFLKAKMVYDSYVNKFVHVSFPLKAEDQVNEDDSEQQKDILYEKLHQFGQQFKQNARINHPSPLKQFIFNQRGTSFVSQQNQSLKKAQSSTFNHRPSIISNTNPIEQVSMSHNQSSKELAAKIKKLYNVTMVCYVNQTMISANKTQNVGKNKKIGRVPDYMSMESGDEGGTPRHIDTTEESVGKMMDNVQQTQTPDGNPEKFQDILERREKSENTSQSSQKLQIEPDQKKRISHQLRENTILQSALEITRKTEIDESGAKTQDRKDSNQSEQRVTDQLRMIEEIKKDDQFTKNENRQNRGFTFNSHLKQQPEIIENSITSKKQKTYHRVISSGQLDISKRLDSSIKSDLEALRQLQGVGDQANHYGMRLSGAIPQRYDGASSNNDIQTEQFGSLHPSNISPLIQQEINNQINIGLKQFFQRLDQKLSQQKVQHTGGNNKTSVHQLIDNTFIQQQQLRSPEMYHNHLPNSSMSPVLNQTQREFVSVPITHYPSQANFYLQQHGGGFSPYEHQHQYYGFNSASESQLLNMKHSKQHMMMDSPPQSKQGSNSDDDEPLDPLMNISYQQKLNKKNVKISSSQRKNN